MACLSGVLSCSVSCNHDSLMDRQLNVLLKLSGNQSKSAPNRNALSNQEIEDPISLTFR